MEVGGSIYTLEGASAYSVEIGTKGKVRGPIRADQAIVGRDADVETVYGNRILLRRGARAESIYGESVTIESDCHIDGEVKYTKELKIGEHVSLTRPPQKVDTLPS
jgi:cytoskeletal protein CcmA (bactofilin family)